MKPRPRFKAVYNLITRELLVRYGDKLTNVTFTDIEEWATVSFDGDDRHPCFLHIQLDYDEIGQLLFYPRVEGSESLNEDLGTYWYSFGKGNPRNVKIVYNDFDWNVKLKDFLKATDNEYDEYKNSGYLSLEECREMLRTNSMDIRLKE